MLNKKMIGILSSVLLTSISSAHAFCVYNQTNGNDPTTNKPIMIDYAFTSKNYAGKVTQKVMKRGIKQNSYLCSRTNSRGFYDYSEVIPFINQNNHQITACPSYAYPVDKFNVFNAGGYIVIKGGFVNGYKTLTCEVHRDGEVS